MNYEILNGRTMFIGDTEFSDIKVKKHSQTGSTTWTVNGYSVRKMDLAVAINIVEEEEREKNRPKGLRKLGLFLGIRKHDDIENERGMVFSSSFGVRTYGFNKCGVFVFFRFGMKTYEFEFCWRDKEQYQGGQFPDPFIDYKQLV